jgi:aminoglycoside phosphotransferase
MMKNLPSDLAAILSGYHQQHIVGGCSTSEVFRLHKAETESLYLKIVPRSAENFLDEEKQRLQWIGDQLPVPHVHFFKRHGDYEYLLISEILGVDATDDSFRHRVEEMVRLLARGLRMIHSVPLDDCPFDQTSKAEIQRARLRLENSLVDEEDFERKYRGWKAEDLFCKLVKTQPQEEDLVFTHGDYCLPNILIDNGMVSGFIDWGFGGISDRYRDLALAVRSLSRNWGDGWEPTLFAEYGITNVDPAKMEFYTLLDEFF